MDKQEPLLNLKNASLTANGTSIFTNLSMRLEAGDIVLLAGPSGVGKSSLMNLINGYYPNEDTIVTCEKLDLAGCNLLDKSHLERTAYVRSIFQNARLSFAMTTPYEEMVFCLENFQFPIEEMDEKITQHAHDYQISHLLERNFSTLSGGELQKVAFACASLIDAPLYLMDEPFANLDEASIPYFMEQIKRLSKAGKAVCIIDHRLDFWDWVDRWYILTSQDSLQVFKLPLDTQAKQVLKKSGLLLDFPPKKEYQLGQKILSFRGASLFVSDDTPLIENITFDLHTGEMIALVGQSGSGKTSFFKALLKQGKLSGNIELFEESLSKIKKQDLYQKIGLVFQDPSLQFVTTKVSNELKISFPNLSHSALEQMLAEFNLDKIQDLSPWLISQGQQRRLAFLTMANSDKKILLVDEPTYGQDLQNAVKIMTALERLCQQGMACIFTSHDQRLVKQFAHKILRIHNKQMEDMSHE